MKTILFFGLRRSGNHGIIGLILSKYKNSIHINDVKLSYRKYCFFKNIPKYDNIGTHNHYVGFNGVDCIVISMENEIKSFIELQKFKNIPNLNIILLLRNPYNNLSSVWKIYEKDIKQTILIKNLWIKYA